MTAVDIILHCVADLRPDVGGLFPGSNCIGDNATCLHALRASQYQQLANRERIISFTYMSMVTNSAEAPLARSIAIW